MKIDLGSYNYEGVWVEFRPGVELLIRPYPRSLDSLMLRSGALEIPGNDLLKQFEYCLIDARGLDVTVNGEKQPLSSAVKKHLFDFDVEGIAAFVIGRVREMAASREAAQKN
jgi:hypothetical protein